MNKNESEYLIQIMYEIASEYHQGFRHQVIKLLQLGCKRFDLDIGILSKIVGQNYEVIYRVCPPEITLHEGDNFTLSDTYCSMTLSAKDPVWIEHVKESSFSSHPAYLNFGLEAYIGVPVYVRNKIYGTLNFSSPFPSQRKFQAKDIDALNLMASWLGAEIERSENEAALKKAEQRFRVALDASPSAMLIIGEDGQIEYANQAAERLFAYNHLELCGRGVEALIPDELCSTHPALREEFMAEPKARAMGVGRDLLAQNAKGQVFPVEVGLNPIATPSGTVVLCAVVDLTERKQYEQKILEQADLLKQANQLLSEQAVTDSLTNLANRRHLMAKMMEYVSLVNRSGDCLSLIMADLDHFKQYNDSFGHPDGDEALKTVALVFKEQARDVDIVARYGGEEFSILLPATDQEGAITIAERIRKATEEITHLNRIVTLSIGVATIKADQHLDDLNLQCSDFIQQADQALYYSKENGRNRVTHFDAIDIQHKTLRESNAT